MQFLDEKFNFMTQGPGYVSRKHDGDKLFAFERGGLLWVFNFHPTKVNQPFFWWIVGIGVDCLLHCI